METKASDELIAVKTIDVSRVMTTALQSAR